MFLRTLINLKVMGFLNNSKHSPFIFKKNYFGKASCGLDMTNPYNQNKEGANLKVKKE
jgi:hypothetical protein